MCTFVFASPKRQTVQRHSVALSAKDGQDWEGGNLCGVFFFWCVCVCVCVCCVCVVCLEIISYV